MKENELEVLEQYDIDVNSTRKIRGAVLCDTKQGVFLLKEVHLSEKRIPLLYQVYCHIREQGYENVDIIVKNREGEFISTGESGTKYLLKSWFYGRECDNKREQDILSGVQNLVLLHRILDSPPDIDGDKIVAIRLKEDLHSEFQRHNREMKKVRSFMRGRVDKGEFESVFLKYFDEMYSWAEGTSFVLERMGYGDLLRESMEKGLLVHGDYNYHNILMIPSGVATTNFEHFYQGIQLDDFYYYLRKTMEKNQWDIELGDKMIECYNRILPLTKEEMSYLAVRIAYPEKFWKAANAYYRSRKAWISAKSIEKLNMAIYQSNERKQFLELLFSFHL